jgi:glycosyltransferase involved in cell wall biosynthesis
MKIGIVINLYPPYQRGGAEYVAVRTVEALLDMGHDVFVITGLPKRKDRKTEFDRNTTERIYRFTPRNLYFLLDDYKYPKFIRLFWHMIDTWSGYAKRQVEEILQKEQPDVVITHNLKGMGLRVPQAVQQLKVPHIHIVHDLQLLYPSGLLFAGKEKLSLWSQPFYAMYRAFCRHAFGNPDLVIFPSQYLKTVYEMEKFFPAANRVVMPNPAPAFEAVQRTERSPGPLRLLFVGQLEHHKGVSFLLDAFEQVETPAQLILAGEGTLSAEVKKRVAQNKHISYLGYVSTSQLVNCLEVADALVVPSLCYENSPTVIYEALQTGVPVIAADIGGVGELIQEGKNGYLFSAGSVDGFLAAVAKVDEKKEWFASVPEKIKKTIAPYALPRYCANLLEHVQRLLRRG